MWQSVNHIFAMPNMQMTNQRATARKANFHSILIGAKQAIDVEEMEIERERVGQSGRERGSNTLHSAIIYACECLLQALLESCWHKNAY